MKYFNTIAAMSFCVLASGLTAQAQLKMRVETKTGISHHEVEMTTEGSIENGILSVNERALGAAKDINMISFVEDSEYLFVKPEKAGNGDGSSWENAMGTVEFITRLCKGDAAALNGKTFCLAGGNYSLYDVNPDNCRVTKENMNYLPIAFSDASETVHITIAGGFDPASTGRSVEGYKPAQYVTTFTGDNTAAGTQGESDAQDASGFYIGANAKVDISDITFTCFYGNRAATFFLQGATGKHADLNVYNSVFTKINVADGGAAVNHYRDGDAAFKLVGCVMENMSGKWGAVVKLCSNINTDYLINCEVRNNTSTDGLFRMDVAGGKFVTVGCNFHDNVMQGSSSYGSIVSTIRDYRADGCRFVNNKNLGSTRALLDGDGSSIVWLNNCYFDGNTAEQGYSTQINVNGNVGLNNCTINEVSNQRGSIGGEPRGIILNSTLIGHNKEGLIHLRTNGKFNVVNSVVLSDNGTSSLFTTQNKSDNYGIALMGYNIVGTNNGNSQAITNTESDLMNQAWVADKFTVDSAAGLIKWDGNWEGHTNATLDGIKTILSDTTGYDATAFVDWLKGLGAVLTDEAGNITGMVDAAGTVRDSKSMWAGSYQK